MIDTPKLDKERSAYMFYVIINGMIILGIIDLIYLNSFNFESGILCVLLILVDFCVMTNLIDINNYLP